MANHQQKQIYERTANEAADRWNARYRPGQVVEYQSHPEAPARTVHTRSEAFVLSGHTACISLEGVRGVVALSACRPVTATAAAEFAQATGQEHTTAARQRLRDRLLAIALEADALRQKLRDALATLEQNRPLTEFALQVRELARQYEGLSGQCGDLHVSQNPNEEGP